MVSEIDVFRTAHLLIHQHGYDAQLWATKRADKLQDDDDVEGHNVFGKVAA